MSALSALQRYPLVTIGLFSTLLFFFNLDALTISIMEARNFLVAREMITEGHWLLTTMNDLPRYEKPPLPAWITAPFIWAFGTETLWAYRLPTSLVATAGVYTLFFLVRRVGGGRDLALFSALVLATSFYYVVIRFEAPSDVYTHVFMLGAICFWEGLEKTRTGWTYALLGGVCFGLSVLAKGPVSLYALFLPFLLAYSTVYRGRWVRWWGRYAVLIAVGLTVGASWYVYLRMVDPQGILQVADKETGNWTSYNVRPFYYYWSFFIQSGIWTIPAAMSLAFPYFRKRVKFKKAYTFSWLWTVGAVVLLSAIPEKKSRYLVPVLIPLAINTAHVLLYIINTPKPTLFDKIFVNTHRVIVLLICVGSPAVYFFVDRSLDGVWLWYSTLVLAMYLIAAFIATNLLRRDTRFLFWTGVLTVSVVTTIGMSGTAFFKANPEFRTLQTLEHDAKMNDPLFYGNLDPEIIWEYGRTLAPLAGEAWDALGREGERLVLVAEPSRENFLGHFTGKPEWQVDKVGTYDRNYFSAPGESGYKTRHVVHVYDVSR